MIAVSIGPATITLDEGPSLRRSAGPPRPVYDLGSLIVALHQVLRSVGTAEALQTLRQLAQEPEALADHWLVPAPHQRVRVAGHADPMWVAAVDADPTHGTLVLTLTETDPAQEGPR